MQPEALALGRIITPSTGLKEPVLDMAIQANPAPPVHGGAQPPVHGGA